MGEYPGRLTLYHADLYRLDDPASRCRTSLLTRSAPTASSSSNGRTRAGKCCRTNICWCEFEVTGENSRTLRVDPNGDRAQSLILCSRIRAPVSDDASLHRHRLRARLDRALARRRLIAEITWRCERNHTVELLPAIDRLLAAAGGAKEDLTAVFVCSGPACTRASASASASPRASPARLASRRSVSDASSSTPTRTPPSRGPSSPSTAPGGASSPGPPTGPPLGAN